KEFRSVVVKRGDQPAYMNIIAQRTKFVDVCLMFFSKGLRFYLSPAGLLLLSHGIFAKERIPFLCNFKTSFNWLLAVLFRGSAIKARRNCSAASLYFPI